MPLTAAQLPDIWQRYRHNFMRHLTAVARHSERQAMARLTRRGYPRLAMSFSAPLSLLAGKPRRLTEIAEILGVSKQLCLQSLKPIEQAGYIERRQDPDDRRAKRVALTERGEILVRDALEQMREIDAEYESLIGAGALGELSRALHKAARVAEVPGGRENAGFDVPVSARVSPLSRSLQENLMAFTAERGHPLQFSFGQVLTGIDLGGTSVSELAKQNAVTTQAISRIAGELETLGYIQRTVSNSDRRTRQLRFTGKGLQLISDSVDSVDTLAEQLRAGMGRHTFEQLQTHCQALYRALGLERDLLSDYRPDAAAHLLGATEDVTAPLTAQAVLAYVAQQLDPALVETDNGAVSLSPKACGDTGLPSLHALKALAEQHPDLAALQSLLRKLRSTGKS